MSWLVPTACLCSSRSWCGVMCRRAPSRSAVAAQRGKAGPPRCRDRSASWSASASCVWPKPTRSSSWLAPCRGCGLLEMSGGSTSYRHGLLRDAVLDIAVPHLVDTLHRRAADCLGRTAGSGTDHDRRARHLAALGAGDAAAAAYTAAADAWLHEHALLAADGAARAGFETAVETPTRRAAADTLVRVLAAQGRWTEALVIDEDIV